MAITIQDLKQAHNDHHALHAGCVEDYFSVVYLEKTYGLSRDDALAQTTFGGHDYGLDGYHFDRATQNFYLFQFKWSKNIGLFKDSLRRLTDAGLSEVFAPKTADQKRNQLIDFIRSLLDEQRTAIKRVYIHFVFCGDATEADRSESLEHLRENLESKKYLLDEFFGTSMDLTVEFRSAATRTVGGGSKVRTTHTYQLGMQRHLLQAGPQGEVMHVGFVPLMALREMFVSMAGRFFERNIRFSLPEDTAPNRAIGKALRDILIDGRQPASVFAFNHNGVTLHAARVVEENGVLKVTEPRLLNGAQTVTTFASFLERHADHPAVKNGSAPLNEILVLARVVSSADDEFVTTVTLNNNRQNPVQPWALRANDFIQRQLHDAFRTELGIFYERQQNAFESYTPEQLEEMEITNPRCIELQRLALTFLASEGHVERMSKLKEVFENDNYYREAFDERRLKANLRHVVLCYKIRQRLSSIVRLIEDHGANKYYFISRGRNLLWALLCQALLNDREILNTAVEKYGDSLTNEVGYTSLLHDLTRKRIIPVLREAIESKPFSQYIEDQKEDFVRTRAFFDRCFDLSVRKFGWVRKNLR